MDQLTKVAVASKNPAKINAVKLAFQRVFPEMSARFIGVAVDSGVANQPMTVEETWQGANNRLRALKTIHHDSTFFVAIEGGIEDKDGTMYAFACILIQSGSHTGQSMTGKFMLPPEVSDLVHQGYELGVADDIVFARHDSKRKNGAIGLLTNNIVTRTTLYEHAVVLALVPFINTRLYLPRD